MHAYEVYERLGWERNDSEIAELVFPLGKVGVLVTSRVTMGGGWNIYPTYLGVVRRLSSPVRHEVMEITEVAPPLASAG